MTLLPDNFPLLPAVFLITLCAFFSASETAFFSLTRFQLRQLKQKNPEVFYRIRHLLDNPSAFVATVLLGNELANVFISNLLASFYQDMHLKPLVITIVNLVTVLPIILIFGEITPKVIGAKANTSVATLFITPFWWFYRVVFPVRFFIEHAVELMTRRLRKRHPQNDEPINEDDIRDLLEDGKKKGAIHSVEQDIIENLFEIDDDKVIDLATPLQDCFTVRQDDSPKRVIDKLNDKFYARIPVVDDDRTKKVVGVLYAKDLLNYINRDEQEMTVRDLMKEPLVVEPQMKAETLFRRFRQLKRHIAVIENKSGTSLAVITMEDILEQMFGELWVEKR
ncbi:MAG: hemolysin family protein [Bdellovibrionota bacterium]